MEEMITAELATEDVELKPLRRQRDLLAGSAEILHEDPDGQLDQQRDSALAAPAGAGAGASWDCQGCGLRNEGCADHCALCHEAPSADGDGQGAGALCEEEETAGDDELQGWDEDAEADRQPRFSVIDEDEVKYFQDGAKEAFAVPLSELVVDEDCLDSSDQTDPQDGVQCLADDFDDGDCF